MKPEKIVELTDIMMQAQQRYFKSKSPEALTHAKNLERRVRDAIAGAKRQNPSLFQPDPLEADIPGVIDSVGGSQQVMVKFLQPWPEVANKLKALSAGRYSTPVRIIVRLEE